MANGTAAKRSVATAAVRYVSGPEVGVAIPGAGRIWAIGSIHGDAGRLARLHDMLAEHIRYGDRVVYLGNLIGYGAAIIETLNELLRFRQAFLARPPFVHRQDILYLRGQQEEIWQKLQQLQFAVNPVKVLEWALAHGAEATLRAYGGDADSALACARGGALAITRWAGTLRETMRAHPGHVALLYGLQRTAYTADMTLLFVNAGIDPARPVDQQADGFWWHNGGFDSIRAPYDGFRNVVRGYDPNHAGFAATPWSVTLDGACGFGGPIIAGCFSADGEIRARVEA